MRYAVVFLSMAMILSTIPGIVQGDHVIDSSQAPQYLYVLSAKSGSFEDSTLTLKDVPLVVYFSERPDRIAGHISLKGFIELWTERFDSFNADPPNASLSIYSNDGNENVVVELMSVELKRDLLTFEIRIIQGELSKDLGPLSLFIDLIDGPGDSSHPGTI